MEAPDGANGKEPDIAQFREHLFLKTGYRSYPTAKYYNDVTGTSVCQPDVYPLAASLAKRFGYKYIIDVGCGRAQKLAALYPEYEIIGVDFGDNLKVCREKYPFGTWIEANLEECEPFDLPHAVLEKAVIICSDVIEHLVDPLPLLRRLRSMLETAPVALLSTPERDLERGLTEIGPPENRCHVREWNLDELGELAGAMGLRVAFMGLTTCNDVTYSLRNSLLGLANRYCSASRIDEVRSACLTGLQELLDQRPGAQAKRTVMEMDARTRAYRKGDNDPKLLSLLRKLRAGMTNVILNKEESQVDAMFKSDFGEAYRLLLRSGFQAEPLNAEEEAIVGGLLDLLRKPDASNSPDPRLMPAYLLYRFLEEGTIPFSPIRVPSWFVRDCVIFPRGGAKIARGGVVAVKLMGGLGNQMFQYAAGLAVARRNNARLKLDLSFLSQKKPRPGFTVRDFALDIFALTPDCDIVKNPSELPQSLKVVHERHFHYDPDVAALPADILMDGYWQSPRYFEAAAVEVRKSFEFTGGLPESLRECSEQILASNAVCVHVRRGDMVHDQKTAQFHGSCGVAYYTAACSLIQKTHPDAHFFVFSDDPKWCADSGFLNGTAHTIINHDEPGDHTASDLRLMTLCRHFVLSNSTFGWWAAYLSQSSTKTVVAPDPWFSDPSQNTSDLLPKSWIRLDRSSGALLKVSCVSVVIPCYNQAQYLEEAVDSVLKQTFSSFEIIIVNDGSLDNTSIVAQSLIERNPRFEIRLLEKKNGGLANARNDGIKIAKGRYILPLDADDKIHPEMLEKSVALLDANPEIAIAYTDQVYFGAENRTMRVCEYNFKQLCSCNFLAYCSLYRREIWDAVGGYNPNMVWGYEDWNFWISCGERGLVGRRIPEPLFFYRVRRDSMLSTAQQHDNELRARVVLNHPKLYALETIAWAEKIAHEAPNQTAESVAPSPCDKPVAEAAPERESVKKEMAAPKVIALISGYNEGDVIYHVVGDLIANGVQVYFLDNHSTDNTVAEASRWLGKGLLKIERFPGNAGDSARSDKEYVWREILRRKEELAAELEADWYIHADADEFRESPWPGKTLAEAIGAVDSLGYNAINFELFNFRPTDDAFVPGSDVRQHLTAYEPTGWLDVVQVKAWKNTGGRVQLVASGGHSAAFSGKRIFPINFILRHYPIRGESHGRRKVFSERLPRFTAEERAAGWHVQYDSFANGTAKFLHAPEKLVPFNIVAVRARLLARASMDFLLAEKLRPGAANGRSIDSSALCGWLGRRLEMKEPLAAQVVQQANGALEILLRTQARGENNIPQEIDTPLIRLLLALCEVNAAFARLEGNSLAANRADSLTRVLGRKLDLTGSPSAAPVTIPAKAAESGPVPPEDFFGKQQTDNIEGIVNAYLKNPADAETLGQLRALRQALGGFLAKQDAERIVALLKGDLGKVYRLMAQSGLQGEPLIPEETALVESLAKNFDQGPSQPFNAGALIAYMIFRRPYHGPVPLDFERIPRWLLDDYLAYLLYSPKVFVRAGDAELHCAYMLGLVRAIDARICAAPDAEITIKTVSLFAQTANFIPLYFTAGSCTRELMEKRARIIEFALAKVGAQLDRDFPERPASRKKIKVGFLSTHFSEQTETYVTLPSLNLDRTKFEICLFPVFAPGGKLEDYCRAHADRFVPLPKDLKERVEVIREADLDVILIGTNITAVPNHIALLAAHRLARIQLVSYCSPVSSGMRNVDGYLSGKLVDFEGACDHYTEKLFLLDGPPGCLDYTVDSQPAKMRFDRKSFGIPEDSIVFVNAAACYKILPEMQETWAKIVKSVEGSRLLLLPFNPNWANTFPVKQFRQSMVEVFRRHGLDESRFILADSLPNRSEVKGLEKLGDVYLDTFPFSGSISTIDPLELGIPPVVWEGNTPRSRFASALLRDLKIDELITSDEQSYIALSVKLALQPEFRASLRKNIQEKMAVTPRFLDSAAYGKRLGDMLEEVVLKPKNAKARPDKEHCAPDAAASPAAAPVESAAAQGAKLKDAIKLHTAGRFSEAEELYRQLLASNPRNADAWHLLGVLAHQCGDNKTAVQFIEQALQFCPENATFWSNLGEARLGQGEPEKAIECGLRALELQPKCVDAMVNLGGALWKADRKKEAVKMLEKALDLDPKHCEALVQYGLALHYAKRFKDAIHILKKACRADRSSFTARYHLGAAFEASGRYAEAMECYESASKVNPNAGMVWNRWGWLVGSGKNFTKAAELLKEALRCEPTNADYLFRYGCILQHGGRSVEALRYYDKAIEAGCDTAELHNNRGVLLKDQRRFCDAVEAFHRAITLRPDMNSALNNLGAACLDIGLTSDALECFELLVKRNPDLASVHNNIGKLLKDTGKAAEAVAAIKRSIELDPSSPAIQSNFLYSLQYVPDRDLLENFNLHRKWGDETAKRIPVKYNHRERISEAKSQLRIGYVSPDYVRHPVSHFIEPLLANHDREKFQVYAYSDTKRPDAVTAHLQPLADVWRTTCDLSNTELAQTVWEDKIDILVDLSGHTALNRLEMFALKPAPAQVSYLGYPATTGLRAIGYRITDHCADPVGMTEHLHTERLVRLPATAWCFQPPAGSPAVKALPSTMKGYVTFGSFNNIAKLNPQLFEWWASILNQVPGSHLRVKSKTLHEPKVQQDLIDFFGQRGIDASRLEMSGSVPTPEGHLNGYNAIDIALDSFPYHGTTTTCEALWMGVPVVSLAGTTHVSRVSLSLLKAIGLSELAAETPEAYVALAVSLAKDQARMSSLREGLRSRMLASPLMDVEGFTAAMEAAFSQIWQDVVVGGNGSRLLETAMEVR